MINCESVNNCIGASLGEAEKGAKRAPGPGEPPGFGQRAPAGLKNYEKQYEKTRTISSSP